MGVLGDAIFVALAAIYAGGADAGATMAQLQAAGRWKSSQTVARYVGVQFAGHSIVAQLYSRKRKKKT